MVRHPGDRHFEWIAPHYDRLFGRGAVEDILADLAVVSGDLVLDVGGGTGRLASAVAARGARVVVVDSSHGMLLGASGRSVAPLRSRAERLPFADATVDRVVIVDAFHHFGDQEAAAREVLRVLRPGGRLVIVEPDIRAVRVKVVAAAERLALMRSRFLAPADLACLLRRSGARLEGWSASGVAVRLVFSRAC